MLFSSLFLSFLIFLNVQNAHSKSESILQLRDHFITNLLEENKGKFDNLLTSEIQDSINLKIDAFLEVINEPHERKRRDTSNELLLNEKTVDVNILRGFEPRGVVPTKFPEDVCMFRIDGKSVAVALSKGKAPVGENMMEVFLRNSGTFQKVYEYKSKYLSKIDCIAMNNIGYVAVVNSISTPMSAENLLQSGSFVYKITLNSENELKIETFQVFAHLKQIAVRLWSRDQNLYLIFTYGSDSSSTVEHCPLFSLVDGTFNKVDDLPCQNAHVVEFFTVKHNRMILIGNYREINGTTNTFSTIMRYDLNQRKFVEHQKLYTNAITVGKYFYLDEQNKRQHFLFIGNSFEVNEFGAINYDVNSIIYKLVNGFFIPLQTINVKHVQAVAPIVGSQYEFHLLIASEESEVQIFFYDGWKFEESTLDFTGDVFSTGVKEIRAYDDIIENTTTIVISNTKSIGNKWNIYTPVYTIKNDSTKLKSSINKWCTDAFERMNSFDVTEAEESLKAALLLTDPNSTEASFLGKVFVNNTTVDTIHSNQFVRSNIVFNNETAQRIMKLAERSKQLEKDTRRLKEKINFTKGTKRVSRQINEEPLIETLIIDDFIDIQNINGKSVGDLVYTSNRKNLELKSIIANDVLIKKQLLVDGKIDDIEISNDYVLLNNLKQTLRHMSLDKLNVKNAEAISINKMPSREFFSMLRRKVSPKIANDIHQLTVERMFVNELLNGRNFTDIAINSLKKSGNQFITGLKNITLLTADEIKFDNERAMISNIPVNQLINVNDTKLNEIAQDIQFEKDVSVNKLFVRERINNVNVRDGKLQVLRKSGIPEQVVTAEKSFNTVKLKESIELRGKIESKTLEKMNPTATVDKNLILQGDYVIKGPVTIRRYINATDNIITSNPDLSLKKLRDFGLNIFTTTSTKNKLIFEDTIEVLGNLQAQSLNKVPVDSFIKSNFNGEQLVTGLKIFKNDLLVRGGTVQADVVNDIDLSHLNETILKRFSPVTQFVNGNIELTELRANKIASHAAKVDGKHFDLLLNTIEEQEIEKITLSNLRAKNLHIDNVSHKSGAKVLGSDLNFLIDDTVTKDQLNEIVTEKNFENLKINHLQFADENEWKSIIRNFNDMVIEDLTLPGGHIFDKEMRISNLDFSGILNDVSYEDMTKNWMKLEGNQIFTAPQTIKFLTVDGDIKLISNKINDLDLNKLVEESIWIDEPITLDTLEINGGLWVNQKVFTPKVNGATLDDKIIRNNSLDYQSLQKIHVAGKSFIERLNFEKINGINYLEFLNTFNGNEGDAKLKVKGSAIFSYHPKIVFLNSINLQELYDQVWLANRDVELHGEDIQFLGDNILENVLYADKLNGKDLDFYSQNYLSKTKDQIINGHLNVNGTVTAQKYFSAEKTIVPKMIKIDERTSFDITDFNRNVLKKNVPQDITGKWHVDKLVIFGDYFGLVNGLNLQSDVLHTGNWETAEITGHKKILFLEAYHVNAKHINGIDMIDWFENSVKINSTEEQVIEGHVVFKKPIVSYDNIQVYGTVNDILISPETVLTKSIPNQVINGNVVVKIFHENFMNQLNIRNLILKDGINGVKWQDIYENMFQEGDQYIRSKKLIFQNELRIDSIHTNKSIYDTDVAEFLKESSSNTKIIQFQNNLKHLHEEGDNLLRSLSDNVIELSHFEHHQSLKGSHIQKIVFFTYKYHENADGHMLAVFEKNLTANLDVINFYPWNHVEHRFSDDSLVSPLFYSLNSHEITKFYKVVYKNVDHLFVEVFDKFKQNFVQNLLLFDTTSNTCIPVVQEHHEKSAMLFTWKLGSQSCYGLAFPSLENIIVNCEGIQPTVIATAPIKKVSAQNELLILLTDDDRVQVLHHETNQFYTLPKIINPQSFTSTRYHDKFYLAVCSDKFEGTIHHGYINIFVSDTKDVSFKHLQKLSLNIPTMVKFSKPPSGDLMLYVITRNPTKALSIYSYAGSSNFVETIADTTIVSEATDIDVAQVDGKTEVLSVLSGDSIIYIIQAALLEY